MNDKKWLVFNFGNCAQEFLMIIFEAKYSREHV